MITLVAEITSGYYKVRARNVVFGLRVLWEESKRAATHQPKSSGSCSVQETIHQTRHNLK
jgi:hypothetical protein